MSNHALNFPDTFKVKQFQNNPITNNLVNDVVSKQLQEPGTGKLKFKLKQFIKYIFKRGIFRPNLYYDRVSDFAFFPRLSQSWINKYYAKSGKSLSYNLKDRNQSYNSNTLYKCAKMIVDFSNVNNFKGKYVDLGSGTGWLARAIYLNTGGSIKAVDISMDAMTHIKKNKENITLETSESFFSNNDNYFDCLYSVDTLEHIIDPLDFMKKIYAKAHKGSKVFVSVPNFASYFSRISLGSYPYYHYPAHLNYFTSKSLRIVSESAGFTVIKQATITFPYEAMYVSRCYNKNLHPPLNSWQINDILNNGTDGERLFILLQK